MKKYITYTILAFFAAIAVSSAAPDKDAMMTKEKTAWQSFQDKKTDEFTKLLSPHFMAVYADGIQTKQQEIDSMKNWDMKSFTISDYTAFSDEKDVMVATYTVKVEGTFEGKDASGTYNAGSVWKMEKGTWMAIFHTNVKQEAAAK